MHQTTRSKQIELASRPHGAPTSSNFKISTTELSAIEKGEFLVKNRWMSVDPYMRGRMKEGDSYVPAFKIGEPLEGGCIGEVVESRHEKFHQGEMVLGNLGWREYWKSSGQSVTVVDPDLAPRADLPWCPGHDRHDRLGRLAQNRRAEIGQHRFCLRCVRSRRFHRLPTRQSQELSRDRQCRKTREDRVAKGQDRD